MIYGDPGSIIPLNIAVAPGSYDLSIPPGLPLARAVANPGYEPAGGPIAVQIVGSGKAASAGVALTRQSYLQSEPLGLDVGADQAPHRLRLSFRGIVPRANGVPLFVLTSWNIGGMTLATRYDSDLLECTISRGDSYESGHFSSVARRPGVEQLLEVEWRDLPGQAGGTLTFFIDGKQAGGPLRTKIKPRITAEMAASANASLGNMRQAADGLVVRELRIDYDRPATRYSYPAVGAGPVSDAVLAALVVDARAIRAEQPPARIAWRGQDGAIATLDIRIGPLEIPPGQPCKAVLVDWSSGQGVPHPNILVMTRIAAQNCRFEDEGLGPDQPAWIECLPQGPVPNIAGIDYRCEAIRAGDYVQFQFGYDWDRAVMPANPFGDPTGRHSHMIPHKWLIYDRDDRLLATVETPDGGPLNGLDKPHLGEFRPGQRWYPHGTVRSGVIWRNRDPAAHDPGAVRAIVPLFDLDIPFGSHLDHSVNGFDLRVGGDGQTNGFGNVRVIRWEWGDRRQRPGETRDPYGGLLYSPGSIASNAPLWLRYTPFNIQGRSPITGAGGVRDDRQIMAEPVACYANAPEGRRPHDGTPWRTIALDYLSGYASDPVHAFERGRNIPVFKGNPQRPVALRNHYYGGGNAALPPSRAWYQQGGQLSDWLRGSSPLRVAVPYAGDTPTTPYFGTFQIDKAHGHQFPGWGSLLFRTPEFAFLGHRFWDQNRLYSNDIIADDWLDLWSSRDGAWAYLHAALAWKTASRSSQRLYSRAEILDFVAGDFERFHARHYAASPGFLHPPPMLEPGGDLRLAVYAAAARFGVVGMGEAGIIQHDFGIGYWLSALSAAAKLGFNAALRARSAKAGELLDWLVAMHRKRIVGRLLHAADHPPLGGADYMVGLWSRDQIAAVGGRVDRLAQDYGDLHRHWGRAPRWDVFLDNGAERLRDGQAMDQLIAGPSLLRYLLGQGGADLNEAQMVAQRRRDAKKADELSKGNRAGSDWFRYLQATNNPARAVQA